MRILYINCFSGFDAKMLLASLIDAGLEKELLEKELLNIGTDAEIILNDAVRVRLECKKVQVLPRDASAVIKASESTDIKNLFSGICATEDTDEITSLCVILAIKMFGIEYIMSSDIGLCHATDGDVLNELYKSGIPTVPSDITGKKMTLADAKLLCMLLNESGPMPQMDILAVGYGAGGLKEDEANIICSYIGEYNGFESKAEKQEYCNEKCNNK